MIGWLSKNNNRPKSIAGDGRGAGPFLAGIVFEISFELVEILFIYASDPLEPSEPSGAPVPQIGSFIEISFLFDLFANASNKCCLIVTNTLPCFWVLRGSMDNRFVYSSPQNDSTEFKRHSKAAGGATTNAQMHQSANAPFDIDLWIPSVSLNAICNDNIIV